MLALQVNSGASHLTDADCSPQDRRGADRSFSPSPRETSSRTYTRHGGHVQFVSLVAVAGVALGHPDAPAVLTAVQDAAVFRSAQAGRLVAPCSDGSGRQEDTGVLVMSIFIYKEK